ncbi:hypothetical protein FACS189475_07350 [Betaproteobacteria bacterium]|nr:hypothetical protein FACS189475_07350 [Betaproteobacteria bacterium]
MYIGFIGPIAIREEHSTLGWRQPEQLLDIAVRTARAEGEADFVQLTMARKDVRLMIETAGALPLATLPSIAARMDALIASGLGNHDSSVLAIDSVRRD